MAITLEHLRKSRGRILGIAERHGARRVRVFGSVVKGRASDSSDIDLLVHFDAERSLIDQVALQNDLRELLGVRVDVVSDEAIHASIRQQVLQEGVPL